MLLENRKAIITGAGQGIGREIALTLAREGCDVAVNDLSPEQAEPVVQEIKGMGRKAIGVAGSVASKQDVQRIFEQAAQGLNGLDIVVNNAGVVLKMPFWEIEERQWDKLMDINLKGVFLCCQAAAQYLRQQLSGKIINIASVAGKRGGGLMGNTAYAASKGGVIALTKGLARELGPYGVNVNAITPALTETPMTAALDPVKKQAIINSMALRRAGRPQDIANAVVFLASPLSDFISGEIMDVDGGLMMD